MNQKKKIKAKKKLLYNKIFHSSIIKKKDEGEKGKSINIILIK
jgi:hypothetical protein